jgi:CHAD domain-containing protein
VLRFQFQQMRRNEEGTARGADIEALHDMRVASRRMRAAFDIFAPAFAPKPMKRHLRGLRAVGRALGTVRDLDVFMQKAERYLNDLPEAERGGLDPLLAAWGAQREAGRAVLLKLFASSKYAAFQEDFAAFTTTPGQDAAKDQAAHDLVRDAAPLLIYTRLARVRAFEDGLDAASIETLHALRIEFKKLRYAVEFFREVLGPEARQVIADLKQMQDHLGDLNDAQVATQLLQAFLADWDQEETPTALTARPDPAGVLAYLTYQHRERHRLIVTFPEAWAHFCRPEFRQNLGLAIAAL